VTSTVPQDSADREAATASQGQASADPTGTLAGRIGRSFTDSVGSIVFGMEDGCRR
jgi:hypothetical protein